MNYGLTFSLQLFCREVYMQMWYSTITERE